MLGEHRTFLSIGKIELRPCAVASTKCLPATAKALSLTVARVQPLPTDTVDGHHFELS